MSVKVSGLSKRIGDTWVLRDITFAAKAGQVFGIYGQSGSGKTTLLKIAAGLSSPNGGSVETESSATLFPSVDRSRAATFFRLKGTDTSRPSLAQLKTAIEECTGALLLDDVLSGLDERERDEGVRLIRGAASRGLTVLVSSSRFDDIMRTCDGVAVINQSYLRQIGTPKEVYEEPATVDVAALVGRCNLIEARRLTSTKKETPEFQTIAGGHRLLARKTDKRELGSINQNVRLAIRPEQISLSFGASFPEDNLLKAKIAGIRFFGCVTYVDLEAGGLSLEALVPKVVGLSVGDECLVALPPDRIIVLKS